ncbi:MAG: GTPase ObgE, partial [Candidatus Yanofskybacteria bacterium]|nr:GTPase ObgE [Candidatus Yanofskybacteria bacterium]
IERTKTIFHLISAESEDVVADYKVVRNELEQYSKELAKKKEFVFLSKYDAISEKDVKKKLAALRKLNKKTAVLSIIDNDSLEKIKVILNAIQASK